MTTETEKIRTLEGAIVDLVSAIHQGDLEPADEITAVNQALWAFPDWKIAVYPLVGNYPEQEAGD